MDNLWKLVVAVGVSAAIAASVGWTTASFGQDFQRVARVPAPAGITLDGGVCAAPEKLLPSS
jgi:hypothetical protein